MTLAQISRATGQRPRSRTALVAVSLTLFGLAAAAASYVALGPTSPAPRPIAALDPVAAQNPSPSATPADVAAVIARPESVAPAQVQPVPAVANIPMEIPIAPEATVPLTVATPAALPEPPAPTLGAEPPAPALGAEPSSPALGAEADCVATLDALAASITVPFDPYAVETTSSAMAPVVDLAQRVAECDTAYIVVAGHADPSGDETLNLVLSWQRAEFVVTHLTDTGFDRNRLEAIGFGSRRPISEGAAGADDTLNRRVDFIVRAELP